jgi:negative regulator of flagellin synthesis FlgM
MRLPVREWTTLDLSCEKAMADPIQGVTPAVSVEVAQTGQAGASSTSSSSAPTPVSGGTTPTIDSADVARAEALLATISASAAEVPEIDEARVSALQQAIQSGTYQANPQQIAQKIIQLEAMLIPQDGGQ